ncbi:LytTR family transcriptional regulator [Azohydromonas sediminis]|uniref:LytTR family transcriptional regulator n=1 Tax=Azohydromonas sediminis TaxID=2259674 RepID=UPI000E65A98D|nr:PAS domain-containing transcriptional regulator [Azohydromonas sediminis]
MDLKGHAVSPLYLLERFDVGIVHLDAERRVLGMNDFARRVLPVDEKQPFDRLVLSFHPERSQPKVEFLLDQAAQCPVANPPPMTMIINIPERVLLIKVTRIADGAGRPSGYVLVFYDITELVSSDDSARAATARRRLQKIPTVVQQRIVLVDADDVLCIHSDGHYTHVCTVQGRHFCNLNIGDLEARLDPEQFMRVHRGHIVNLRAVRQLRREDGRLLIEMHPEMPPIPVSRSSASALLERLGVPVGAAGRPA